MYFRDFDSFQAAQETGTSFCVVATVKEGDQTVDVISSPVPIDQFGWVVDQLEEVAASSAIWYQWDARQKRIFAIPYANIVRISFALV